MKPNTIHRMDCLDGMRQMPADWDALVLDPFNGRQWLGFEKSEEYVADANERIAHAINPTFLTTGEIYEHL